MEKTHTGLNKLIGKDIKIAIYILGYPTSKQEIAGDIVYVWSVDKYGQIMMPATNYISGTVGTTQVYGTVTSTVAQQIHSVCSIKIVTNSGGLIVAHEISGNYYGCESCMHRLSGYADLGTTTAYGVGVNIEATNQSGHHENAAINSDIENILGKYKKGANIAFALFNGYAVIIGETTSMDDLEKIRQSVSSINGIKKVIYEVNHVSHLSGNSADLDKTIEQAISYRINREMGNGVPRYRVIVWNRIAYLLGEVRKDDGRQIADIAARTQGVSKVVKVFRYAE